MTNNDDVGGLCLYSPPSWREWLGQVMQGSVGLAHQRFITTANTLFMLNYLHSHRPSYCFQLWCMMATAEIFSVLMVPVFVQIVVVCCPQRQLKKPQSMLQDRHSLIHLVQRLRRENRSVLTWWKNPGQCWHGEKKTGQCCQGENTVLPGWEHRPVLSGWKNSVAMVKTQVWCPGKKTWHVSVTGGRKQVCDVTVRSVLL